MGIFKNIISGVVSESIGKVVGQAVEKTVAPAADRFAQKQAERIDNEAKKITITLTEPQFMSHEIDESGFKFYDAKNSIFTETKLEDYTTLMSNLKAEKEEQLRNDGEFFPSVTENAKNVLNDIFKVAESTTDYEIVYN